MFQTLHEISKNLIFVFVWKYVWKKKIPRGKKEFQGLPGGAVVKNLPANAGDTGSIPGPGRSHMPRSN